MRFLLMCGLWTAALGLYSSPVPSMVQQEAKLVKKCQELGWKWSQGAPTVCAKSFCTPTKVQFLKARTTCENEGARLCTKEEIIAGEAAGTGCGYDKQHVWTSTECKEGNHFVVQGNGDIKAQPPKCLRAVETGYVRCCADGPPPSVAKTPDLVKTDVYQTFYKNLASTKQERSLYQRVKNLEKILGPKVHPADRTKPKNNVNVYFAKAGFNLNLGQPGQTAQGKADLAAQGEKEAPGPDAQPKAEEEQVIPMAQSVWDTQKPVKAASGRVVIHPGQTYSMKVPIPVLAHPELMSKLATAPVATAPPAPVKAAPSPLDTSVNPFVKVAQPEAPPVPTFLQNTEKQVIVNGSLPVPTHNETGPQLNSLPKIPRQTFPPQLPSLHPPMNGKDVTRDVNFAAVAKALGYPDKNLSMTMATVVVHNEIGEGAMAPIKTRAPRMITPAPVFDFSGDRDTKPYQIGALKNLDDALSLPVSDAAATTVEAEIGVPRDLEEARKKKLDCMMGTGPCGDEDAPAPKPYFPSVVFSHSTMTPTVDLGKVENTLPVSPSYHDETI